MCSHRCDNIDSTRVGRHVLHTLVASHGGARRGQLTSHRHRGAAPSTLTTPSPASPLSCRPISFHEGRCTTRDVWKVSAICNQRSFVCGCILGRRAQKNRLSSGFAYSSVLLWGGRRMSPYASLQATSFVRLGEQDLRPYRFVNKITRVGQVKPPFFVSSTLFTFPEKRVIV
jgi:hypothetical protein